MTSKVTDDPLQPSVGHDGRADVTVVRRRRPSPSGSALLFDDGHPGVSRLYTVAMMADVLRVPRAAVRHWLRGGLIAPAQKSGSIEWFAFPQLVVGRTLGRLLEAGFSLRDIDAKLAGLAPGGAAEAARMAERIVADGRRLSIRRNDELVGAGGQLQLGFYTAGLAAAPDPVPSLPLSPPASGDCPGGMTVALSTGISAPGGEHEEADDGHDVHAPASVAELLDLAADLEAAGALTEAAEALRAVLQAAGPTAQVVFMLAELLYRAGDLTAARERYYAAVELDEDHLEARSSLGCVLAELGEDDLAIAALDGVLRQQPDYADAHWHMAAVLRDAGRESESRHHLRMFLALAPESPWAAMARERLAAAEPIEP